MRRIQLFEFTDLSFWPEVFRALLTDHLHTFLEISRPFTPRVSTIAEALRRGKTREIVDLCTGGSGPWLHLKTEVEKELGEEISVLLTDKFPNQASAERVSKTPGIEYCMESVDALAIPDRFGGIRTLVDSLHHFPPRLARDILADSVAKGRPIVILEGLQRNWRELIQVALLPLFVVLLAPMVKPFKWSRMLFTYLLPVAPVVIGWDGAVSVLRCYTPDELLEMGRSTGDSFEWQAGTYRHNGFAVTWLSGVPKGSPVLNDEKQAA
jgi:hypothetical protein